MHTRRHHGYRSTAPHRAALLLLALCATASTARTLMSSGYCDWGGFDNSKYPWAKPRSERDWYCGNTALFNSEAEGAAGSGEVRALHCIHLNYNA